MEPLGVGALQLAFEQLKKKLEAEGLFDPARKKHLPLCPQNICIVTSRTGAAIRDILKVFERSPYPLSVTLFPVAVQGSEARREISEAIAAADELAGKQEWDLLIVGGEAAAWKTCGRLTRRRSPGRLRDRRSRSFRR